MASILRQVQDQIAAQLRESEALSACPIYAEDQKDLEFQIKNALGRQGLVIVVATPRATYMGKLDDTSLAWQLDELEIDAVENPPVNRGRSGFITGQEAAMKAFEILCPTAGDAEGQICPVRYEQGQDQGLLVSRAVFKCLVTSDEQPGPEPAPQIKKWFVKLLDEAPADGTALQNGWMWQTDDGFVVVKDGVAQELGGISEDEVSTMISSAISSKADLSSLGGYLPAKFSGPNDEYAAVQKIVEIQDVRSSSYNEPVLALVQNGSQRSLEIINSPSMATLDLGVLSSGVPKISFGFDDPETFNTVYFQNKSGTLAYLSDLSAKADLSALSSYLPLSGGQLNGVLSVGTGVQVFNEADGGVVTISDGSSNQTFYQHNKIGTPNGNLYYPASIPAGDETLATQEYVNGIVGDINTVLDTINGEVI